VLITVMCFVMPIPSALNFILQIVFQHKTNLNILAVEFHLAILLAGLQQLIFTRAVGST
jgi:hypothetical protein